MEKFLKWCSVTLASVLLAFGVVSTLAVPVMATDEIEIQPRGMTPGENARTTPGENTRTAVPPTFVAEADESDESIRLHIGRNLLLAGNNLKTSTSAPNGIMLAAGNNLELTSEAEYGILAGNTINYSGSTSRDLFIAGNYITLRKEAVIGRDTYVAGETLIVETDLAGDLSVTAANIELRNVTIDGNVNLAVENIKFTGAIKIAGALVYNGNAVVSGLENISAGSIEAYDVPEVNPTTQLVAMIYSKITSIAALFIIIAIICALYPKLHDKISTETSVNHFGINLALGFGALLLIPIVALIAFISYIVAPLGLIALALYAILIYLAQGFAGIWLGHLIIEKGLKTKGNLFAEAFVGILILGILALIPYVGAITGFLGLFLGLGLIIQCIKPTKDIQPKFVAKLEAESEDETEEADTETVKSENRAKKSAAKSKTQKKK